MRIIAEDIKDFKKAEEQVKKLGEFFTSQFDTIEIDWSNEDAVKLVKEGGNQLDLRYVTQKGFSVERIILDPAVIDEQSLTIYIRHKDKSADFIAIKWVFKKQTFFEILT